MIFINHESVKEGKSISVGWVLVERVKELCGFCFPKLRHAIGKNKTSRRFLNKFEVKSQPFLIVISS